MKICIVSVVLNLYTYIEESFHILKTQILFQCISGINKKMRWLDGIIDSTKAFDCVDHNKLEEY